jgi:hypothetical protein
VAILDAHLDFPVVRTARVPLAASDTADLPLISTGRAARGFDEPAPHAFLGANWLRTLEAVLP